MTPTEEQTKAAAAVGEAFAVGPSDDLTPQQKAAFKGVQEAFSSPTVITDETIRNEVNPENTARANALPEPGKKRNPQGIIEGMAPEGSKQSSAGFFVAPNGEYYTDAPDVQYDFNDTFDQLQEAGITASPVTGVSDEDREYNGLLNEMRLSSDRVTKSIISSIENKYAVLRSQQEDINKRQQQGVEKVLLLAGTSRYAPITAGSISSAQERAGIMELAALEAEEQQLIANAKNAQEAQNFELLAKQLDRVDAKRAEKAKVQEALAKTLAKEIEDAKAKQMQATRDFAIAGLVEQGITDPAEIMKALNEASVAGGYGPSDFTAKEISETLEYIAKENGASSAGALTGDAKNFFTIRDNYPQYLPAAVAALPEDQQLAAYINYMENGGTSTRSGGVGTGSGSGGSLEFNWNKVPTDANLFTVQVGPKIYGGRISNDESERIESIAKQGIAQGKTYAEIFDTTLGYSVSRNQDLADNLRNVLLTITDSSKGLIDFDMPGLARLIEDGKDVNAITRVENLVMDKAREEQSDIYMSEASVRYAAEKTDEIREKITAMGGEEPIGVVSGTMQNWIRRFKGKKAAEIRASFTTLVAEMRNRLSGTAVTESEARFLEPLIPDLSDRPDVFMTKLAQLESDPLMRMNNIRDTYLLPRLDKESLLNKDLRVGLYSQSGDPLGIFSNESAANANDPLGINSP